MHGHPTWSLHRDGKACLELVTGVLPEPEVLGDLVEGVEVDHPLQDLGGLQHPLSGGLFSF